VLNPPPAASDAAPLEVLYRDADYVAVHKPAGLLVHRSRLAAESGRCALQLLRNQLGARVYPLHRLDRATSGVLLFALAPAGASRLGEAFAAHRIERRYRAVVRGWVDDAGLIDHPVRDRDAGGAAKPAATRYRCLARVELAEAVDRYPTSRYSLVEVEPLTGRRHQIRQHFKHLHHPLIGDTSYGKGRHNRFFRERYGLDRLLLEAHHLGFAHPADGRPVRIDTCADGCWRRVFALFGFAPQAAHPSPH
jgi:tRNA pseudouridine65 synthase